MKYNELFPTEFNSNPKLKNRFFNYYKTFFKEVGIKKKTRPVKYLSLFTGIGGFEVAIQSIFPSADCIGYSEIKKSAIEVYSQHFPTHKNLGNINDITKEQIQELVRREGCDLIVGGFPCTNLSSIARTNKNANSQGLDGPKSGLFWTMCNIIEWIVEINKDVDILVENNGSMKNVWKEVISNNLKDVLKRDVHLNKINGNEIWVQTRNRIYWTTFKIGNYKKVNMILKDVLDYNIDDYYKVSDNLLNNTINGFRNKKKDCKVCYKILKHYDETYSYIESDRHTRLCFGEHNDSENTHSRPIPATGSMYIILLDKRINNQKFILRNYTVNELEKLFSFPVNYLNIKKIHKSKDLLGNSLIISVILSLLNHL